VVRGPKACGFALLLLLQVGCRVSLGDDRTFSCSTDKDCGGDGYVCTPGEPGQTGRCCKPSAKDDCKPPPPDGGCADTVDLMNDVKNCGFCGFHCDPSDKCMGGQCLPSTELSCSDGLDNDKNGETDCADPACEGRQCALGCTCVNGAKRETDCTDGVDNDTNGKTDCADSACEGSECGAGCVCSNMMKIESDCSDGKDNDGDGMKDCADSDCNMVACSPAPASFVCGGGTCQCNGGAPLPEDGGVACRDGVDDDCNGYTDCADPACDLESCNPDGGAGCVCAGHKATELNCGDLLDNDNDGLTDCADFIDCPAPVNCTVVADGGNHLGTCAGDHTCQ
jgi:hypothetical protein